MKELFKAFWDLCLMTKYMPELPIKLKNIYLLHQGNKLTEKLHNFIFIKYSNKN